MYIVNEKEFVCPVAVTNDIFNDKWKLAIVWHLLDGDKRYKELHEEVYEITQKTLTVKLKELEQKQLIKREVFAEVPPKVVYSLTSIGEELRDVLNAMHAWGIFYAKSCGTIVEDTACKNKVIGN
ncbi:helix-turn-helix domain-containing protein [Arcobacter sp. 15-2]|uniref:winged helix-turn-helix transcriptional regulator n=1 Tax=Arcobacter sp. 15-2 TaxID=3374109 RepID=UPI00399CDFD5